MMVAMILTISSKASGSCHIADSKAVAENSDVEYSVGADSDNSAAEI